MTATPPAQTAASEARVAGRGGVAVLGAKVFFILVGFVQQPLLRLAVGLSDFGGLAQAMVVANVVNNVVVSSATQGVSRTVAGAPANEGEALRATLRVHTPLAACIALVMMAAAPAYAAFERADDVVLPLFVLAGVAFFYGLYAPLIGHLNGTRRFSRQAALDVTFATLRTLGLVGVGYLFVRRGMSGVLGTTIGWVAAAAAIVPLAIRSAGLGKALPAGARPAHVPTGRAYLAVLLPIAGVQLCTNLLMQVDIALLGRFLSEALAHDPSIAVAGVTARDAVKEWVAIYKECQTFAFLPYQLLFSVTLVLFPMVARAHATGDREAVRTYVARGARLAAIFCGLLVGVVVALPGSMLVFAYGAPDATRGADVLRVLVLTQAAFAMLGVATTVLTSIGRERTAALLTVSAVIAVGVACWTLVPAARFGHDQLVRSAAATGGALLVTLMVGGFLVHRHTGAFVPAATIARTLLALSGCVALGFVLPRFGRFVTPVAALAVAILYLVVLVVTRELGKADLATLRAMIARKKA